jgi:hypothetical protein
MALLRQAKARAACSGFFVRHDGSRQSAGFRPARHASANLPRYTSYPTAPHFMALNEAQLRGWFAATMQFEIIGGRTRIRTLDPLIKSQLLYQLSYAPGGWVTPT